MEDKQTESQLRDAIEKILPIVQTLTSSQWSRIVSIINSRYVSKAAKVQLDGNDIELLNRTLKFEILGEQTIK